jgi:hypothetical protein
MDEVAEEQEAYGEVRPLKEPADIRAHMEQLLERQSGEREQTERA